MANEWVKDVSFDDGDDVIRDSRPPKYQATQKNKTDRLGIVMRKRGPDGKIDPEKIGFLVANTHYHSAVGYVVCTNGRCCERLGAPKSRIGTIICKYPTDNDGAVDKKRLGETEVMMWILNSDKFNDLKRRNKSNPLHLKDIEVTCKDPQYQKLDIVPSGEAIWPKIEELKAKILKRAEELEKILPDQLGKKMTTAELIEALGDDSDIHEGAVDSVDYSEALKDL